MTAPVTADYAWHDVIAAAEATRHAITATHHWIDDRLDAWDAAHPPPKEPATTPDQPEATPDRPEATPGAEPTAEGPDMTDQPTDDHTAQEQADQQRAAEEQAEHDRAEAELRAAIDADLDS